MKSVKGYVFTLTAGILAALFVRFFILTAYKVPTGSMQPALKPGDYIFSSRRAYQFQWPLWMAAVIHRQINRGDIIVFHFPNQPQNQYVKRVIGLPGDAIEFEGDFLRINGQSLNYKKTQDTENNPNSEAFEIYTEEGLGLNHKIILSQQHKPVQGIKAKMGRVLVLPGQVYVLGDNRDTSDDSRYWGSVPIENISGQVKLVWMSFNSAGKIRWSRIFSPLH